MKLTKKQLNEFRNLIEKAKEIDHEFMDSQLPIRLKFTWALETNKNNEWLE